MESKYHLIISSIVALLSFLFLGYDFILALVILFAGWLIDVDHEIDFYVLTGRFAFNPIELIQKGGNLWAMNKERMFSPLHGWELLIIGLLINIPIPILFSYMIHLFMDVLSMGMPIHQMSLFYRLKNGWKTETTKL